ncbi:MAG TPA: hypothetical protein VFQ23_03955 [Anaerolineales bacterium]|nr:hypothetical protein [Anaerolineales bacterium]
MNESIQIGDRVKVFLDSKFWKSEGWFEGVVVRIDPYSEHRSFFWVELDQDALALLGSGTKLISVLNPKNIQKIPAGSIPS